MEKRFDTKRDIQNWIQEVDKKMFDFNILNYDRLEEYEYKELESNGGQSFWEFYRAKVNTYDGNYSQYFRLEKMKEILFEDEKFNLTIEGKKKYESVEDISNQSEIYRYIAGKMNEICPWDEEIMTDGAVKKWFAKEYRTPDRRKMFWLSFALDLPLVEGELKTFSHQTLFYKVFGQPDRTRDAEELCMLYCKKRGLKYEHALALYNTYLREATSNSQRDNEELDVGGKEVNTYSIYQGKLANDISEEEFLEYLKTNQDVLQNRNAGILKRIRYLSEEKWDRERLKKFSERYKLKKEFTQGKCEHKLCTFKEYILPIKNRFGASKRDDARETILNKLREKGMKKIDIDDFDFRLLDEIVVYQEDFATENKDGSIYVKMDKYYLKLRKIFIFVHFINYWYEYVENELELDDGESKIIYEHYIREINMELARHFFSPLYPYNSFELFILLCSKTKDPIYTYYCVLSYFYNFVIKY